MFQWFIFTVCELYLECKILKFVANFVICHSCYLGKEPGGPRPINITDRSSPIKMQPVTTTNTKTRYKVIVTHIFLLPHVFKSSQIFTGSYNSVILLHIKVLISNQHLLFALQSNHPFCLAMQPPILPSHITRR